MDNSVCYTIIMATLIAPPSQVDAQSIVGLPPVQVRPNTGQPALASNSVTGHVIVVTSTQTNKGRGNN